MTSNVETPSGKSAAGENFPVGSWFIRRRLRPHVARFYAFARAIDDIADNPELAPGDKMKLGAGESVTLLPGMYHEFWAEGADALIGEVSTVNDDVTDNYFYEPLGRFPEIDEDEPPYRLLVGDYAAL